MNDLDFIGLRSMFSFSYTKLHTFLTLTVQLAQITRIDLAYDDFEGFHSVDWALTQYMAGGFNAGANAPKPSQIGN